MKIALDRYLITKKSRPLLVAELSCNHCGSLNLAKKIIKEAKAQGADLIKFQTYEPETMTLKSEKSVFKIKKGLWKNKKLWELYDKAKTPFSWQKKLFAYAKKINIPAFSTPYDESALDLLEKINCPIYKIASFELTDLPLINKISKTKKPVIISTGMASLKEIEEAVKILKGKNKFIILYCVTNYPAKFQDFNLYNIKILQKKFGCFVGLSDHSNDKSIAALSVAMGAKIFEKHIALTHQPKSFDYEFSLKGKEIKEFSNTIKNAWKAIHKGKYKVSKSQNPMKKFRRSIFITKDVEKNELISDKNIKVLRPDGNGLQPKFYDKVIGKRFKGKFKSGSPLFKKYII